MDGSVEPAPDRGPVTQQDRDAALGALEAHRRAGRLDDVGFEERGVRAARASTREELGLLFLDLPEPHPTFGPPAWGDAPDTPPTPGYGAPPASAPQRRPPTGPAGPAPQRPPGLSPEVARRIVALMPFVALALFFLTKSWLVFLLIPAVAIALGRDGRHR